MAVLREILHWSPHLPAWQRDALRRLVVVGELSDEDLRSLAEICKAEQGLAEPQEFVPLAREHVPDEGTAGTSVSLVSIFHHRGVNALAENQTLRFSPRLTVVYGDNAAGKTGYIRILKTACRARAQEKMLGNVVSGVAPPAPDVAIKYSLEKDPGAREWTWQEDDEFISRVSVFDSRSAAVYLTEKTNVAFRPFGLDLFDKLARVCNAISDQLTAEQRALASHELAHLRERVPDGTAVSRLLANINVLTKPEQVRELSRLSLEDESRLDLLERSLLDLRANDPEKLRQALVVRARRVAMLPCTSRIVCAVASSFSSRATFASSWRTLELRGWDSAGFVPRFFGLRPCSEPLRRALRHAVRCELYRPSRRSSRPTSPGPVQRSASSRIRSRYSALNWRRVGLATTSGSGAPLDRPAPALGASSLRSSPPRAGACASIPVIESLSSLIAIHLNRPPLIPRVAAVSTMLAERARPSYEFVDESFGPARALRAVWTARGQR